MADAMMIAAQTAFDSNNQHIENLVAQLKIARERKKIMKEALKREKAHYKEYVKTAKASAVSAPTSSGGAVKATSVTYSCPIARRRAAANGVFSDLPGRYYVDNYPNRKLGRVGLPIPSRMGR